MLKIDESMSQQNNAPKLQFSPPVEIFASTFLKSPVDYFEGCSTDGARRRLLCLSDLQPLKSPACSDWSPLIWSLADQRWGWRETLTFTEVISGPVAASGGLQGELHHLIATSVAPGPCFGSVFIIIIIMNKLMFLPLPFIFILLLLLLYFLPPLLSSRWMLWFQMEVTECFGLDWMSVCFGPEATSCWSGSISVPSQPCEKKTIIAYIMVSEVDFETRRLTVELKAKATRSTETSGIFG